MFSAVTISLYSVHFWVFGVLFPLSFLSWTCLVSCQNQDPVQSLSWNRNSHSWQLLQFHTPWSVMLFPKPRVWNAFSLQKNTIKQVREQFYFSNSHFYSSKAYGRRKVLKHRYHNRMSVSVFLCCLCTTVTHKETFSSVFWFSWSLSNSVIALFRLSQHLPSPRPGPYHRRKEEEWLEAPLLVSEVFRNLHRL